MSTRRSSWHSLGLSLVLLLAAGSLACGSGNEEAHRSEVAESTATFVGLESCVTCHERETRLWRGSHHDLAMQEATDETVLADFDNTTFTYAGVTSTFTRRNGGFWVETDGPDGELNEFEVSYTFGAEPLQQFLIGFPGGRYQALNVVWDTRPAEEGGQRWYHLYPDDAIDHADPFHWTGAYQNWNHACAECHSTELRKAYDSERRQFETSWSEINVSCEACHGPASRHVEWAEAAERGEKLALENGGLVFQLADRSGGQWEMNWETGIAARSVPRDSGQQVESCARCHSRRSTLTEDYEFGRPLLDTHRPSLIEEALYHPDGQILDEVYVYGSFMQSKMYEAGVACSDCHDPHALTLAEPDAACATCHSVQRFATPEHHFHEPESRGASCVECHMVSRDYMGVDGRRDHSFRVPRPDLTLELGSPNACTGCHANRSVEWAAEVSAKWYGDPEPHYGEGLAAGRLGGPGAAAALERLADDSQIPAIVRATAVQLLGRQLRSTSVSVLQRSLDHRDPLIRLAAVQALEGLEPVARWQLGSPRLSDSIRAVRLEATRILATVPADLRGGRYALDFDAALVELREYLLMDSDRASAQLLLGSLAVQEGDPVAAEQAFRRAIELDRTYGPAYVNLADLLRALDRDVDGEAVLREGLGLAAESAGLHHAYGLLLVRLGRSAQALEELARAADLRPDIPRYGYVWAVALENAGQRGRALDLLAEVHYRHPGDIEVLSALVSYHQARGEMDAASAYAAKLRELSPERPGA